MESKEYILVQKLLPSLSKAELGKLFMTLRGLGITSKYALSTEEAIELTEKMKAVMKKLYRLDISGRSQDNTAFMCRLCVAEELFKRGYNVTSVGKCLHRSHSSVIYYTKRLENINKYPSMYPEYFEIKRKFKASLNA